MTQCFRNPMSVAKAGLMLLLMVTLASPSYLMGAEKKQRQPEVPVSLYDKIDKSKLVWPQPPYVGRVRWLDYFAGEKLPDFAALAAQSKTKTKSKNSWMDRLAGVSDEKSGDPLKGHFFMGEPHGVAVDPKGTIYVADGKVGVIFVINPETHDTTLIKNGQHANFGLIMGVAADDSGGRLFVADSQAHHVLVLGSNHKQESVITQGLVEPVGLAIDYENRFLYVADLGLDQILVYDVDNYNLIRTIGTPGTKHASTKPGDFAKPTGVAVDQDGNLYVADMLNARIEVFDPDGNFIRTFGKRGDMAGRFAMPKGVAIDADGHVWVTDSIQNRIQVYTQEGDLLMYIGTTTGKLPGQFSGLQGIAIDPKQNRVFTTEVFPGRVQEFRYVTQNEAKVEFDRREAEKAAKAAGKSATTPSAAKAAAK